MMVVQMEPTHTTNMTRFLISSRGCSFLKEAITACRNSSEYLNSTFVLIVFLKFPVFELEGSSHQHQPMLDHRPEAKGRKEGQRGHDNDDARQSKTERQTVSRQSA